MCIFTGKESWCLKVHVVHLETLYKRLKSFFKADLSTNTTHLHDGITLLLRPKSFSYFLFMYFFLIYLSQKDQKSCFVQESETMRILVVAVKWCHRANSLFLLSCLLHLCWSSSFYFNHSGTLQCSAVISYDIIINIDKKMNLFALQRKIEFGLCKKLENFVINKTWKMPTAFCQATKSSVPLILTRLSFRGHLISRTILINVIGYTNNSRVSFANRVSRMKKK